MEINPQNLDTVANEIYFALVRDGYICSLKNRGTGKPIISIETRESLLVICTITISPKEIEISPKASTSQDFDRIHNLTHFVLSETFVKRHISGDPEIVILES